MLRRRAVVRLEGDDPRAREVLVEVEDVLDLGAAPAVDRLVLVADGAERLRALAEELDEGVLRGVRVLVLVDQEVPDPAALLGEHRGIPGQQAHRARDEVVEVEGARGRELLLVERVDLPDALAREVRLGRDETLGAHERVLRARDAGADGVGRQDLVRDRELRHRLLDERELVRGVGDREARRQLRLAAAAAQQAQRSTSGTSR